MIAETQENEGYSRFRRAMNDGVIEAGMVLTQNELCDLLGLSLTPLRETLVLLEQFGLVEIKPRAGIRIVYPEVGFIRENLQFRALIETYAVRVFAGLVRPAWLKDMHRRHEAARALIRQDDDYEKGKSALLVLDAEFHRTIVGALENRPVLDTHGRLQENLKLARRVHQRAQFTPQLIATIDEHEAILDRLAEHDAEGAVRALEEHFKGSTHRTYAV